MRSRSRLLALLWLSQGFAATFSFHIVGDDHGCWPQILSSIGLKQDAHGLTTPERRAVFVIRDPAAPTGQWIERAEHGAFLIVEGDSPMAQQLGFRPGRQRVPVRNVLDRHRPKLPILWEKPLALPVYTLPPGAQVFARERWQGAPLAAGLRKGAGAILWLAITPGVQGYERFPYLLHALGDLGLEAPLRSGGLWAFFDSSYRSRVDLDYFAERWRRSGIGALHVAAWHYWEPDPQRDEYLRRLIQACHRRAILVYAWLELPHVSEKFWNDHPQWREKTALLQDAHLDWRKLMNLVNRDCSAEVTRGARGLIERFDWDGINLAELYFESLEGAANPSRFTPMNDDVRREFQAQSGFDPLDLFREKPDPQRLRAFQDYRAGLARRMQSEWLAEIDSARRSRRDLDLVLTHVDDRFDTRMREAIGADSAGTLPLLDRHDFTFLIEDPATVWHLGPQRYPEIAVRYRPLTRRTEKLAIDINIVERYQDVYPTKQQTGTELFQLVQLASRAFPRVALYFENSILPPDLPLLASAATVADRIEAAGGRLVMDSPRGLGLPWKGPATVNGRPWPVSDGETLWLPPGPHAIEPAASHPPMRLLDLNASLKTATSLPAGIEFAYQSASRALARLDAAPSSMEIDGAAVQPVMLDGTVLALPRGQHLVRITR